MAPEALLYSLDRLNPAMRPLDPLLAVPHLASHTTFAAGMQLIFAGFDAQPGTDGSSLIELLREPARRHPQSLPEQLHAALVEWAPWLGVDVHIFRSHFAVIEDLRREEAPPTHPRPAPKPAVGMPPVSATVHYAEDREWMARLVLVAKNAPVWLSQLATTYRQPVGSLDQVPEEELDRLAELGISGIWLIGLWKRSHASREIKQRRGAGTAASAYAVDTYDVAPELGGWEALTKLQQTALQRGIRLGGDMVPNHTGLDSTWVVEHPEWFVTTPEPPYPTYRFTGANLAADPRVEIRIEDHYWDGTDAAVVFQRRDLERGDVTYLYHGNDGTALPWNDTAQIDYLNEEARSAVTDTIVKVARALPIVRFDAAMTLTRRHIRRLWHPAPGSGGAIPSRTGRGVDAASFDRHLPGEFWSEVTARVAADAPGTLLLAEAFWLLEAYFVRTLGMHRVYNSAFMHMTAAGDNAALRSLIAETVALDPAILGRYVTFMSNPDEEPAVAQYGSGERYFAVCTLMVTLPGLPMFGHGQIEGLAERYGMEFVAPMVTEEPDAAVTARHRAEITPLLRRRADFAGAEDFRLYDLVNVDGAVDEDVYVFTNRGPGGRALVIVNLSARHVDGFVARSQPHLGERGTETTTIAATIGGGVFGAFDLTAGGIRLIASDPDRGLALHLGPYERRVLVDFEPVPVAAADAADFGDDVFTDVDSATAECRRGVLRHRYAAVVEMACNPESPAARLRSAVAAYREAAAAIGLDPPGADATLETAARLQASRADTTELPAGMDNEPGAGLCFTVATALTDPAEPALLDTITEDILSRHSARSAQWASLRRALAPFRTWARTVHGIPPGEAAAIVGSVLRRRPVTAAAIAAVPPALVAAAMLWLALGDASSAAARRHAAATVAALISELEGSAAGNVTPRKPAGGDE